MEKQITPEERNLLLLESLIPPSEKLYVWSYDRQGRLIASSCPEDEKEFLDRAFHSLGGIEQALSYAHSGENEKPLLIGSVIGMQWAATFEAEKNHGLIFVTGPVFYTQPLEKQIRENLKSLPFGRENRILTNELCRLLPEFPVMPYAVFIRYMMLIHNTLTGQQLGPEDLFPETAPGIELSSDTPKKSDRNKVYLAEQALLQMVRSGDISYEGAFRNSMNMSAGVPVKGQDPLRASKTSIIVFITLVSRAAMEGGLSPEIAYPLGDSYIQTVENCNDSGELSALGYTIYHDFIYRVHYLHANPAYSRTIQKCCDYIEMSVGRKIKIADLAALAGYSEYYLSEKFKKETGQSINTYIRNAKAERAKVLLRTTDLSVREISERLAFSTVNFFIKSFKDAAGVTPAQYRKRYRNG